MKVVLRSALIFFLLMMAGFAIMDYVYDGRIRFSYFQHRIIFFLVGGLFIGLIRWWGNERKHKNTPPD
jgi:hypothetical protein